MRWPPVEPMAPPKSTDSVSASASAKLEMAWPARNPPNVPYANLRRGTKLSPPPCCRVWQLKLVQPLQSISKNVRASPQAVGVRVSTLNLVCCGVHEKTPLPREWLADAGCGGRPGTIMGPLSGTEFRLPFCPEFDDIVPGIGVLAPCRKYSPVRSMKPPTRIEVSVPGMRKDRGKLPPMIA